MRRNKCGEKCEATNWEREENLGMPRWRSGASAGWPVGCLAGCADGSAPHRALQFSNASRWRRASRWRWSRPRAVASWLPLRLKARRLSTLWIQVRGRRLVLRKFRRRLRAKLRGPASVVCRGSHGRRLGSAGVHRASTLAARPRAAPSPLRLDPVDHSLRPHADHAAARNPDGHDPAGAPAGGLSLSAPGAGNADRALEPHADGPGADDDLVPDDAGAQSGRPAGRRALSRRPDHRHRSHRSRRAAGEASSCCATPARKTSPCSPPPARFRARTRRTTCPCAW